MLVGIINSTIRNDTFTYIDVLLMTVCVKTRNYFTEIKFSDELNSQTCKKRQIETVYNSNFQHE